MAISQIKQFNDSITWTGDICTDIRVFLKHHGYFDIAQHSLQVGALARELAERFNVVPTRAELAGWLHDISVVIPPDQYLIAAQAWEVTVFSEEQACPRLLHQKLSMVIARDVFHVSDEGVLSAIGCHTTLKLGMLPLDKVVFLANKIVKFQAEQLAYMAEMQRVLYQMPSLDAAIEVYCDHRWDHRYQKDIFAHRWFRDTSYIMGQV